MEVLFNMNEKVPKLPIYNGIWNLGSYGQQYLQYYITKLSVENGEQYALLLTVALVISTFLFKNVFNYFASQHITKVKNGVLHDLREKMYDKIISLPISYYSEKRKGDTISRIAGDVNEVQSSFLSILELIVKEPLTILFTIIAMFTISVKLTIFVFIFIPISGTVISFIGKKLKKQPEIQSRSFFTVPLLKRCCFQENSKTMTIK